MWQKDHKKYCLKRRVQRNPDTNPKKKQHGWLSELIAYSQTEWYVVIDTSFAKPGYGKLIKQHLVIKD